MREIVDRCNVCRKAKGEANHWLLMICPANASPYFVAWDDHRAGEEGMGHVCGDACCHKALDEWLSGQHVERTATARQAAMDIQPLEYPEAQ